MLTAIERLALALAFAIIVIVPGLGIALTGRNLASEHQTPIEVAGATLLLLRLATLGVVSLSVLVIGTRLLRVGSASLNRDETVLLLAYLMFFATNVLLPAVFGAIPDFEKGYFYVLALFLALFLAREHGGGSVLDAVKWSILLFLLMSFVYAVVRPDAALRFDKAELRLPLIPFRFWGLGTSPNSIGPMALTALLIMVVRPFRWRAMQAIALTSAVVILLLAQSQTTWIATALILPLLLLYRWRLRTRGPFRLRVPPGLVIALVCLALAAGVLLVASLLSAPPGRIRATPGLGGGVGDLMTGRGSIWRVALSTFAEHPVFGYGLLTWGSEFRLAIAMPYAFHAHNQLLQSLSVAGLVGAIGFLAYLVILMRSSFRTAADTGGLAPALAVLALIGSISEAPFDLAPPLLGDTMRHALLFGLIAAGFHQRATATVGARDARATRIRPPGSALAVADGPRPGSPQIA